MAQINRESDDEDDDSVQDEGDGKQGEPDWDDLTDIEMDPPPTQNIPTQATTSTTTQPILTPIIQPTPEMPIQRIPEPETQPQPPPPPSPTTKNQNKEPESVAFDVVTTTAATIDVAVSETEAAITPTKKLRAKHLAKRRKLVGVPEEEE